MAYIASNAHPSDYLDRVRTALRAFGEEMIRRRVYRTTLTELQALSNRDLADMGMKRTELKRVAYAAAYES